MMTACADGPATQEDRVDMPNLPHLRDDREFSLGVFSPDLQETPVGKPRSPRLVVFSCVCLAVLALGLTYTVMQPAEYQATTRLEITPASATPAPADDTAGAKTGADTGGGTARGPRSFLTEVQVLTSRPLIEEVVERLSKSGGLPPDIGSDPVDAVRHMLSTETVEGTEVVLLRAEGPQRQFLAQLVNSLTSVYQKHLATAYEKSTGSGVDQLRDSVQALDEKVAAKRQEVEAFRSTNDIVSTERDENQLLSAAKGLATALNEAKSKLAAAEGQLRAVRDAASAGQGLVAAKDNPTVADLERRASQLREELHDLLQRFTPQYLDLDPDAKAKRARLDNLEQQIKTERAAGQRAAVAEAEGKVTAAREATEQLQQQINENKNAVQTFMARFGEFKAMQEDLTHLEQLHRAASDRLARLEASDSEVAPQVEILEAANVPQLPWRPLYARGAGISLGVASIKGAPRQLRHIRRFEDFHLGSDLAVAGFQSRQAVRSGAVQLFEMREILLHRLEFAKTRHEGLHCIFVFIDLLLQLLGGFAGGGHFSFRFGNRGSLTGSALRFDLLFEVVEPRSLGFCVRVQIQILRCEPLQEIMQLLAQLRGAPFQICDGRVVLGGDEPLARRSGVPYRAQLSLGRSQLALGLIEGGGEAFCCGQQLVLVSLSRDDIVGRPECLYLLPFRRHFFVQGLNRVAQLVDTASRRFLVSSR